MNIIKDFIYELYKLTAEDKIIWEKPLLNIYCAKYDGFELYTELPQDAQPVLEIKIGDLASSLQGYYVEMIVHLNELIRDQHRRLGKYEYSCEAKSRAAELDKKQKEEARKRIEDFERLAKDFTNTP